ncbi:hypothetical protein D769_03980 [Cupriavidus sp. HMR-1]|nr:hypothetical protein D769_03980 [Cupriavidus sp. HMR-1]
MIVAPIARNLRGSVSGFGAQSIMVFNPDISRLVVARNMAKDR